MRFEIYGLVDPRNGCVRYIGKTEVGLEKRLINHLEGYKEHNKKARWVTGLFNLDMAPTITLLEEVQDGEDWRNVERFWIASLRAAGAKLLNMTDGGEGSRNLNRKPTSQARQRMSLAAKQRVARDGHTIASVRLGLTPEVLERQKLASSAANLGKKKPEGMIANLADAKRGVKLIRTPEREAAWRKNGLANALKRWSPQ